MGRHIFNIHSSNFKIFRDWNRILIYFVQVNKCFVLNEVETLRLWLKIFKFEVVYWNEFVLICLMLWKLLFCKTLPFFCYSNQRILYHEFLFKISYMKAIYFVVNIIIIARFIGVVITTFCSSFAYYYF